MARYNLIVLPVGKKKLLQEKLRKAILDGDGELANAIAEVLQGSKIIDRKSNDHIPKHGTLHEYITYRCKCDACRAVYSDYRKKKNLAK